MGQHIDELMQRYGLASTPKFAKGGLNDVDSEGYGSQIEDFLNSLNRNNVTGEVVELYPENRIVLPIDLIDHGYESQIEDFLNSRNVKPSSEEYGSQVEDFLNSRNANVAPDEYGSQIENFLNSRAPEVVVPEASPAPEPAPAEEISKVIDPDVYFEKLKEDYKLDEAPTVTPNPERVQPNLSNLAKNYNVTDYLYSEPKPEPATQFIAEPKTDMVDDPFYAEEPAPVEAAPVEAAPTEVVPTEPKVTAASNLQDMLARYQTGEGAYGTELKLAREESKRESEAFQDMLKRAMTEPAGNAPSKAEMYFRLAAAFGAPTKTGSFGESLAKASESMAEYKKAEREATSAAKAQRLQLGIKGQEMRMQGSKENLAALRSLAGEEMKDKRAIALEMMKEYVKSGQPQSSAGKQALDEGLKPGTPDFQKRVAAIAELNIEKQMASINAALSGISVAQGNAALAGQKFDFQQKQAAKLTGPEIKLKTETEDVIASTDQAMKNLQRAYQLNPNTFDSSLVDTVQRKALEAAGSKDPKVIATREQENILTKQVLTQLKGAFGSAPSDAEQRIMTSVQGIGSKSKEERALILKEAYKALKNKIEQQRKRLNEINQGLYRETTTGDIE